MIDGLNELGSFVGQMAEDSHRREAAQLAPLETNERLDRIERKLDAEAARAEVERLRAEAERQRLIAESAKRDADEAERKANEKFMRWIGIATLAVSAASMIFGALAVLIAFYALTH